jgi:FkbM family methyltransferase
MNAAGEHPSPSATVGRVGPDSWTLEERLKHRLVPGSLYIRYRVWKERAHGEAEIALLPFLVDCTRAAVDAGANKGVYTYALSRLCPRVYAFEPYPKMLRILRATARANVTVSSLALSDRTGSAVFRVPRHRKGGLSNQGGSLSEAKVDGPHVAFDVATASLDDLDIGAVGFMKIDVEGTELQVLEGARHLVARDRPVLLVEIEEAHCKLLLEDAIAKVVDMGYRAYFYDATKHCIRSFAEFDKGLHTYGRQEDYIFNFIFLPV